MKNEILKERAKQLARPLKKELIEHDSIEILTFNLAHEQYGIETKYAKEVQLLKDYTLLPSPPAYIFGITNIRRSILTIIDLKVLFGLPVTDIESKKIIILQDAEKEFGILSNGFEGIQKVPIDEIQESLPILMDFKAEVLKGITPKGIIILDGKKLLDSKQIILDESVDL